MGTLAHALLPLLLVVVVLAVVAFLPRREVGNPVLGLVRVLFPSWRFFDDVQATPSLRMRWSHGEEELSSEWHDLAPQASSRSPLALLWNPGGNLRLAEHVLLERLMDDVAAWNERDARSVESLLSYELVLNLVRTQLDAAGVARKGMRFQFKLVEPHAADGVPDDDLLISAEHTA